MMYVFALTKIALVALFARAWIEMSVDVLNAIRNSGRPLCEGVD